MPAIFRTEFGEGCARIAGPAKARDPVTAAALAPHEIRNMVDEMFEAQMQWLPQFQGKTNKAPGHTIGRLPTGVTEMKIGENVHGKLFASGKEPV